MCYFHLFADLNSTISLPSGINRSTITPNHTTTTSINSIINGITVNPLELMFFFFLLAIGIALNISLLLLFLTRHKIASSYHLLANLVSSNCFGCFFLLPQFIFTLFKPDGDIIRSGKWSCEVLQAIEDAWWISQNFTVLLISYERYNYIARPFHQNESPTKVLCNIVGIWCATSALSSMVFTPWVQVTYHPSYKSCKKEWERSLPYSILYTIFTFFIPAFALFYSHIFMLRECYLKTKIINVVSGTIIQGDRTINPDQYAAKCGRNKGNGVVKEPLPNSNNNNSNNNNSLNYQRNLTRDISSAWSRSSSRTGSLNDINAIRKKSIQTKSMRKSVNTTIMIFSTYLLATLPQIILIFFHMSGLKATKNLEHATIIRYSLIITFPYIFGPNTKIIKKELKQMYHRMRCWHSGKITPSLNIDEKDYTDNVVRRDSRRGSFAASRKNSIIKPMDDNLQIPVMPSPVYLIRNGKADKITLPPVQ